MPAVKVKFHTCILSSNINYIVPFFCSLKFIYRKLKILKLILFCDKELCTLTICTVLAMGVTSIGLLHLCKVIRVTKSGFSFLYYKSISLFYV